MPDFDLPQAVYLSISGPVRTWLGGRTRALLLRNRYFTRYAGVETVIVTFDDDPVYPDQREQLIERGELIPGMRLLNIFETYREQPLIVGPPSSPALPESLPEPTGLEAIDVAHPDGTVYYTAHRDADGVEQLRDYRRPDGSVFLRSPGPEFLRDGPFILTDPAGRPVHRWATRSEWRQHWFRHLAGDAERVIVISDSRPVLRAIWPMPDERFHVFLVLHNNHMLANLPWNAPAHPAYAWAFEHLADFDGLVTLTERQRSDLGQLLGRRSTMFVAGNPVTLPQRPDPLPDRAPARFAMMSRFESQKRIHEAVRAFARVARQRPQARLEIYGGGEDQPQVEGLIAKLELTGHVVLKGWDPDARDTLWTATALLLSSRFEGYPLATLESMARGCPVISYDIKYGPREQITDGVDGFLVPDGDRAAMAARMIELIDDPARSAAMSAAAFDRAADFDHRAFLEQWRVALTTGLQRRRTRVQLDRVRLRVDRFDDGPSSLAGRMADRLPRLARLVRGATGRGRPRPLTFDAELVVRGSWPAGALKRAKVTLDLVAGDGTVTGVPVEVTRAGRRFALASRFPAVRVSADPPVLRVRLLWRNAAWEKSLPLPR